MGISGRLDKFDANRRKIQIAINGNILKIGQIPCSQKKNQNGKKWKYLEDW